ncbi:BREX system P-loop protein BrxC [Rubrivirga litoralis]|uniref:BREX system P-loop protein BrxC n=1 Tax=Rubrivirga litoralis TaxID=3075598 RepID=A0ABU3BQ73_9BACT|nr:BREX system P-loop protein BrxC [Rubrivirga sp. F394]MDT0631439.1 BREX system P-loop protein BrxC [Rubrivirga sp. F394]
MSTSAAPIESLFSRDIHRRIEEVIKVDQTDDEVVLQEVEEYVATEAICGHMAQVLDRYNDTYSQPHEGIGVWISGFFGSGKSSFAKVLGLALQNRPLDGLPAAQRVGRQFVGPCGEKVRVLLAQIAERAPTEAVVFDVSSDRGIKSGNQTLTEIAYRQLLKALGYATDLDLAELEIALEGEGRLADFQAAFARLYDKDWAQAKSLAVFAVTQASRTMHELDPDTYPAADSWQTGGLGRADITPALLAERTALLVDRRRPGHNLAFVVDEVGQFVARDVQKMLDVQALVQALGRVGRGRFWLVVTSQEKLSEVVGGLDGTRVELARLMDRFPTQVHLEPSDIAEVTAKRVLSKNADAQDTLRALYADHHGRLAKNTQLSADIRLPDLTAERFVELYPLLPYHVDLVIGVVSGLRTQGGASKHVGGANRTIIKLAQQLLVRPDTDLASKPIGRLATLDLVYDLVAGNIPSEIRGKIDAIPDTVEHPLAQDAAKAVALLTYVQSVHRTADNVAASLYPEVDADSVLPQVQDALDELVACHQVRRGDDGYRIPTPAEDDWERQRAGAQPRPADSARLYKTAAEALWKPQPSHALHGTRLFKAGLVVGGERLVDGDLPVYVELDDPARLDDAKAQARARSQAEPGAVVWAAALDPALVRAADEAYRSRDILTRRERQAKTPDELALVAEEKARLSRAQSELQARLARALLGGGAYFRGNDRSPDPKAPDVRRAAEALVAQALPQVYDRYAEAAVQVGRRDLETLLSSESLRGLPATFTDLGLLRDTDGTPVFVTDGGPLHEVLAVVTRQASLGDPATGRALTDHFAAEPYGWEFDVVRLLAVSLVRAGAVVATSQGKEIDGATGTEARTAFPNNNLFRQASFRPKEGLDGRKLVEAARHVEATFGVRVDELSEEAVARTLRAQADRVEPEIADAAARLAQHALPGRDVLAGALDQLRAVRSGSGQSAVLTFLSAHHQIAEAVKRAADLEAALTEPRLDILDRARQTLQAQAPVLRAEPDLPPEVADAAGHLDDLLRRELFFQSLPEIERHAGTLRSAYDARFEQASTDRAAAYGDALAALRDTPGWDALADDDRQSVAEPLAAYAQDPAPDTPFSQLRAETDACPGRLVRAQQEVIRRVEGGRVVHVRAGQYATGGIHDPAELDAALGALRQACLDALADGKTLFLQ